LASAIKFLWGKYKGGDGIPAAFCQAYDEDCRANRRGVLEPITPDEKQLIPYVIADNIAEKIWWSVKRIVDGSSFPQDREIVRKEMAVIGELQRLPALL
jgi:hypothetical protein